MPRSGQSAKLAEIKIPQIARWRIAGLHDNKIAKMLGMTSVAIAIIVASQEYKDYEAALLNKHLAKMDAALEGKVEVLHNEFRAAVPSALRCLVEAVNQRKDLKAALDAAKEIFKRDPDRTFPENKQDETVAPGVPAAVLDDAVEAGNKIAETYVKKEAVN